MLWVDKYRPKNLNDLDYHDDISRRLKSLAKNPASLPHLFFYGPSGSGKRTRITAFLGALFGPSAHRLKLTQRSFTTPTGMTFEIHMISSEHHMELSPGDAGRNDRFVIQDVLKDIASSKNISSSLANMKGGGIFGSSSHTKTDPNAISANNAGKESEIKVVVLNQVDKLSRQAQAALRRTMEKYAASCRLILCCDSPSKLIAPLRSRCLGIRVGAPSEEQVQRECNIMLCVMESGLCLATIYH
jgi:replication factor C subunit 3/5